MTVRDRWDERTDLTKLEREQMRQLEQNLHGEERTEHERLYAAMKANRGKCRSCKMPVYWAITRTNKRIPIDLETQKEPAAGQFDLKANDAGELRAVYIDAHETAMRTQSGKAGGRTSHFATCEHADQHRKR